MLPRRRSAVSGRLWMIREVGLRRWFHYEQARREGIQIDYAEVIGLDAMAVLEEHMESVPWRPGYATRNDRSTT